MSIYATWLSIEHPEQWVAEHESVGVSAGLIGDFSEQADIGSPWVYQGSHVLPQRTDRRGGCVDVAAVPSFITRDYKDDGSDLNDWLRLSVDNYPSDTRYEGEPYVAGGRAVVVLDRAQVQVLRDTLTAWLDREAEE